ncbi:MAG: 2'-5' RNA ligase family protein [Nostocoides sp.]
MPTIGVAVAVPEPFGSALRRMRDSFGDALAAGIPTHITLLPPTEVDEGSYAAFEAHLAGVTRTVAPFEVLLRGTGTFRPVSPVVFVQVARGISECEQLEAAVRGGPLERDLEFSYHPHVTVAQHLDDEALELAFEALAGYAATFTVSSIALYRHGDGGGADDAWRVVRTFPLGDAGSGGASGAPVAARTGG